jgi:transposase
MKRFVEGVGRDQGGLFPAHLEDFAAEDNPVRAVDAFVEKLDLRSDSTRSIPAPPAGRAIFRLSY